MLGRKKPLKFSFIACCTQANMGEPNQNILSFSSKYGMLMEFPGTDCTRFLESTHRKLF